MTFESRPIQSERKPSAASRSARSVIGGVLAQILKLRQVLKNRQARSVDTERRVHLLKRTVILLLSGLLILLLLRSSVRLLVAMRFLSLGNFFSMASAEMPADVNGFTNVLLLGEGDSDHDGVDLTDTIMVVSLDPKKTLSAVMLSLPRDLYALETAKMGGGRINSLYRNYKGYLMLHDGMEESAASQAAMKELASEIGTMVNLPIHGVVKVNFSGFVQAIDAIGGIDVDVPEDIDDQQYPGPNDTYEPFQTSAGPQHLDGGMALKYARSRHSTSDFSRSARQQQIIAATGQKLKESGLIRSASKLTELYGVVSENVESTFNVRELLGLASIGQQIDHSRIVRMQLSDKNGYYSEGPLAAPGGLLYAPPRDQFEGASVLLPASIPEMPVTWKQIRLFGTLLFEQRQFFVFPQRIAMLNAGAKEGSARRLASELTRFGFTVSSVANYPRELLEPTKSAIVPLLAPDGKESAAREAFGKFLTDVLGLRSGPAQVPPLAADADFIIVISKDFTFKPLQSLVEIK